MELSGFIKLLGYGIFYLVEDAIFEYLHWNYLDGQGWYDMFRIGEWIPPDDTLLLITNAVCGFLAPLGKWKKFFRYALVYHIIFLILRNITGFFR